MKNHWNHAAAGITLVLLSAIASACQPDPTAPSADQSLSQDDRLDLG